MLQFWIGFSCTFGCAICSTKCKSYEYSCFIFCFVHLMKDYFSYHCEEIWGRCLLFWSVLSWFWLFWSHYLSWALFFLNSSPLQYGISFNYKLTRTSWWGPLWENNRLLPTSPPKKSDPPPPVWCEALSVHRLQEPLHSPPPVGGRLASQTAQPRSSSTGAVRTWKVLPISLDGVDCTNLRCSWSNWGQGWPQMCGAEEIVWRLLQGGQRRWLPSW